MALTMEKPKLPSGSDSQEMSENSWSYSPKLMDVDANIKLWLARVLLTRWEQKARRVQQPNGRVGQAPFSAESALIVVGLVIVKKLSRTVDN
jgi:hypothetical protein